MSIHRRPPSVGLPSTPRARSFATGPTRSDIPSRPPSSASERPPPSSYSRYPTFVSERLPPTSYHYYQDPPPPPPPQPRILRAQRSVGTLSRRPTASSRPRSLDRTAELRDASYSRHEPRPPLPSLSGGPGIGEVQRRGRAPAPPPTHATSRSDDYNAYRRRVDRLSNTTSSSSGSDGFERFSRSTASSRTSMEDMDMEDEKDEKPPAGFGSSLWGGITGVANNLTISVGKAWASNIAAYSGEETPVGGESRLTRAMKAYHVEKARDPRDLPDWLFDERERGVRDQARAVGASERKLVQETRPSDLSRSATSVREDRPLPTARIARGPTLADRQAGPTSSAASVARAGSEEHVTKSMSRLRELRDAKRRAKVRFGEDEDEGMPAPPPPEPVARPARRPPPVSERMPAPTRPMGNMGAPLGAPLGVRGQQRSTRVGLPSGVRPMRL